MKRMKAWLWLFIAALFLFTGCGKTDDVRRTFDTGDAWYVGFGQAEIEIPFDTDDPLYIAGYRNGAEIEGVLDLQRVSAVWMGTDAETGILLIGVDCVGLGSDTAAEIRSMLDSRPQHAGCMEIIVYSTHTHAGIDTLGLWGPVAVDGKNDAFMKSLMRAAQHAADAAYESRTRGALYFGQCPTEGMQYDSRVPYIYDENLYQLRFLPDDTAKNGTRIVFFAAHAEALRGDNRLVSRDFPGVIADTVRAETGDNLLFVPGAIGGLVMTPILLDEAEKEGNPDFYAENCTKTGELLAEYVLSITEERKLPPFYAYAQTAFSIPLDNTLFLYYKFLGILGNPMSKNGTVGETGYALTTVCGALRLGDDVTVAMLPGEIFPELVYADTAFCRAGEDYTLTDETFASLSSLADESGAGQLLIAGLCNDEIGYILPPQAYMIHPTLPYFDGITDENGENHYEETNSVGIRCAQCLADAFAKVLSALSAR